MAALVRAFLRVLFLTEEEELEKRSGDRGVGGAAADLDSTKKSLQSTLSLFPPALSCPFYDLAEERNIFPLKPASSCVLRQRQQQLEKAVAVLRLFFLWLVVDAVENQFFCLSHQSSFSFHVKTPKKQRRNGQLSLGGQASGQSRGSYGKDPRGGGGEEGAGEVFLEGIERKKIKKTPTSTKERKKSIFPTLCFSNMLAVPVLLHFFSKASRCES